MFDTEVETIVAQFAQNYPPLLVVNEAAEIARVPKGTIYDWSARGLLNPFKAKRGRRVLLVRDDFVRFVLSGTQHDSLSASRQLV